MTKEELAKKYEKELDIQRKIVDEVQELLKLKLKEHDVEDKFGVLIVGSMALGEDDFSLVFKTNMTDYMSSYFLNTIQLMLKGQDVEHVKDPVIVPDNILLN